MLNFTGSTKKRVVNLGNRTTGANQQRFLEQQRLQRLERERLRREDDAARVIQRYVRCYLDLHHHIAALLPPALLELAIAYIRLASRWCPDSPSLPAYITQVIESINTNAHQLLPLDLRLLVVACQRVNLTKAMDTLVLNAPDNYFNAPPGTFAGVLSSTTSLPVALKVNIGDSVDAFVHWLMNHPDPKQLAYPQLINQAYLNLVPYTRDLPNETLVQLLAVCIGAVGSVALLDVSVVTSLLSPITTSISDDEDEPGMVVEPWIERNLVQLYSSQFLDKLLQLERHKLLSSLAVLIQLSPQHRSKLCTAICVKREVFGYLYNELRGHEVYQKIVNSPTPLYSLVSQFASIANELDFWKLVYMFIELLLFFLVVTNDISLQKDQGLFSLVQLAEFADLLKNLALTFIIKRPEGSWDRIKYASINLLNQIHSINQRLKFLPADFNTLKEIPMNVDILYKVYKARADREDADLTVTLLNVYAAQLEILEHLPYFFPFMDRVHLFRLLVSVDHLENWFTFHQSKLEALIRRGHIFEDGYAAFALAGPEFKNQLAINFTSDVGGREAGIDGGGLTKEFLTSTIAEAFRSDLHLLAETGNRQYYPSPEIYYKLTLDVDTPDQHSYLRQLQYLGLIIGKCLLEGVLVDVPFAPFFLKKWCKSNEASSINDLAELDESLYLNLLKLEKLLSDEIDELGLTFTVDENINGTVIPFNLIPGGDQVAVTTENRLTYIHQLANFRLNRLLRAQTNSFIQGLYKVIDSLWLALFDAEELKLLISGEDKINIEEWIKLLAIGGGYHDEDVTIKNFWEVVREFDVEDQKKLLKYVTLVGRPPLTGFLLLEPPFTINFAGKDLNRLPTALTCVNLLKLPDYKDKKLLREKLLYVINLEAGFDLS